MLKKSFHIFWSLLFALLLLAAVMLTAARVWMPSLSVYQHEIEIAASQILDKQISIGRLEATWRGLSPVIKLKNVVVAGQGRSTGGQVILGIREVWITLDVRHYLTEREIRFHEIDVIGTDLTLVRDSAGKVYLEPFSSGANDSSALQDMADMRRLSVHDVNITYIDEASDKPPWRFSGINLSLRNQGDDHTFSGHAYLPSELGYRVVIEAQLYGKNEYLKDWQGQVYIKGQSIALSAVPARYLPDSAALRGIADARLWADVAGLSIRSASVEVDIHDLQISHTDERQEYAFKADKLSGKFGWQVGEQGWQFAAQNIDIRQEQHNWATENLSLSARHLQNGLVIKGNTMLLDLDGTGTLLPVLPGISADTRQLLAGLHPRGVLKDLAFSILKQDGTTELTGFSAAFSGITVDQSGAFPLVAGLQGSISGSQDAGELVLDSHSAGIHPANIFRNTLPLDLAQGTFRWQRTGQHLEVGTDALVIRNNDLSLVTAFAADIPLDEGAASINLQIDVVSADMGRINYYLPAKVMPARGVAWLDRSLKQGAISNGRVIINGRIDQLPFDQGEGVLEVRLPVTDVVLDYNKDWSPVTGLDAQVDFTGRVMDIRSSKGAIRSASLKNIHARIKNLARPDLILRGDVHGQLSVMLAELGSSPLGKTYGGFVDNVKGGGKTKLGLDIRIPLVDSHAPIEVAGIISLAGNSLAVNNSDFALQQISGRLDFDSAGIRGEALQADMYGHPAAVRVWTEAGKGITNISIDGPLDLFDRVLDPGSKLAEALKGGSDWQVLVTIRGIPERGELADIGVSVSTSLAGTAIDLPPPLGKRSDATRRLSIIGDRIAHKKKNLRVSYGGDVEAMLEVTAGKQGYELLRGTVSMGGDAPALPKKAELVVTGQLERFHVTEWQPFLEGDASPGLPVRMSLSVAELEVLGYLMDAVSAEIEVSGRTWIIKSDGPAVAGDILLQHTGTGLERVVMNLQRLVLKPGDTEQPVEESGATPASFPDLKITVQQLVYDEADLGLFELNVYKQPGNILNIEHVLFSSDLLSAQLSGSWRLDNGEQISSADLTISDGEMDNLMKLLGYQPSIKDGKLSGSMRMTWQGTPWDYSPSIADGKVRIKIKDGQLLDIEPGAAGRILGLLSLSKLPRRLLLDFSDLFGDGFKFDKIKGNFVIDDGNAYTNDLVVDGPAAKIAISGRIGLAVQDYDELVTVTPYLKTGIPLAGTLAAGPAVGAVLLVAEKLLKDKLEPLNRIAQKQYSLTGSWADPVLEKLDSATAEEEPDEAVEDE